jgi:hypothetical protein
VERCLRARRRTIVLPESGVARAYLTTLRSRNSTVVRKIAGVGSPLSRAGRNTACSIQRSSAARFSTAPAPVALNVLMSGRPSSSMRTSMATRIGDRPVLPGGIRSSGARLPDIILGGSSRGLAGPALAPAQPTTTSNAVVPTHAMPGPTTSLALPPRHREPRRSRAKALAPPAWPWKHPPAPTGARTSEA